MDDQLQAVRAKVEVRFSPDEPFLQTRELCAFVRYCVFRIERDLGPCEHWLVIIASGRDGVAATVVVDHDHEELARTEHDFDAPLAAWSAMCRIEEALRPALARIAR